MAKAEFYSAVYMLIENSMGEYLFMRRKNTGFRDGEYQIPAGHIEGTETMIECAVRESKEELNIDIKKKDCKVVHISHRISLQNRGLNSRVYFDIYVKVNKYSGKLKINEPHKCSEIKFININNILEEDKKLFSYDLQILKKIKNNECFSEIK